MAAKIAGFKENHSSESILVTAIKSEPKKTDCTPSILNRHFASGEFLASSSELNSAFPVPITSTPGINFKAAGFGVSSVCINMLIFSPKPNNSKILCEKLTLMYQQYHMLKSNYSKIIRTN